MSYSPQAVMPVAASVRKLHPAHRPIRNSKPIVWRFPALGYAAVVRASCRNSADYDATELGL
jgi:hypothetical protein